MRCHADGAGSRQKLLSGAEVQLLAGATTATRWTLCSCAQAGLHLEVLETQGVVNWIGISSPIETPIYQSIPAIPLCKILRIQSKEVGDVQPFLALILLPLVLHMYKGVEKR